MLVDAAFRRKPKVYPLGRPIGFNGFSFPVYRPLRPPKLIDITRFGMRNEKTLRGYR